MSTCASCGLVLASDVALCPHHHVTNDEWAAGNRVMCNFIHRHIVPARLSAEERSDEFWRNADSSGV